MSPDRIVWVGHSTVLVELGGARVLTDPLLRPRMAHLRRHSAKPSIGTEPIDAVLLSHLHHDHVDGPSLRQLGREIPVLVPQGAGRTVQRLGVRDVREVAVGESAEVAPGLTARAVPATHDGKRLPWTRPADAIGWVLEAARRVYFAGDTDVFDGMADIAGGADLALLPVWGWGPSIGPGHMGLAEAARAAALIRPRVAVPIHWGTFLPLGIAARRPHLLTWPGEAFAEHCAVDAPDTEVVVLTPGEALDLVSDPSPGSARPGPTGPATGTSGPPAPAG